MEKLEPARQAIVEITMNDGSVLSNRVTAVRGTAGNPMPRDEVIRGVRWLNPGCITRPRGDAGRSFAWLTVQDGKLTSWEFVRV